MKRATLVGIALFTLLIACDRRSPGGVDPTVLREVDLAAIAGVPAATGPAWWNDTVFYEVFVRSFRDSDGDGVGDLRGLLDKLDYLNDGDPATDTDLGVTGLWLMPVTVSPSYHGYDVVDYDNIDPEYGTNDDLRALVDACHARGMRVIVDFVPNHTSAQHPWFVSAAADPKSPYRDWYVWRENDPGYEKPWGGSPWHRTPNGWYYGIFWSGMPDLNYRNPEVTAAIDAAARVWLGDFGVDGLRLDAVKHLVEDGPVQENTPESRGWLRGFRAFTKTVRPDALTVGEVWSGSHEIAPYIVGGSLDLAFEFGLAGAMLQSASFETRTAVASATRAATSLYPENQFAPFLSNHDQARVMTTLTGSVARAKSAASLLLTGPGVPFLYYGEEVGQRGGKPDENIRTPMQWSDAPGAGFTDGPAAWRPPQPDYPEVNVARESGDPHSLLAHYRALLRVRNARPELRRGTWREVPAGDERLYAFVRELDGKSTLVLINLSGAPITGYGLDLESGSLKQGRARDLLEDRPVAPPWLNDAGGFAGYRPVESVPPYSTWVLDLE